MHINKNEINGISESIDNMKSIWGQLAQHKDGMDNLSHVLLLNGEPWHNGILHTFSHHVLKHVYN